MVTDIVHETCDCVTSEYEWMRVREEWYIRVDEMNHDVGDGVIILLPHSHCP